MPPARYGQWEVVNTLGEGGMGVVYRARSVTDPAAGEVALKVARTREPDTIARLRAEISALSQIHHPSVVQVVDQGVSEGTPWYAMELIQGRTLRAWLDDLWPGAASGPSADTLAGAGPTAPAPPPQARPAEGVRLAANGRLTEVLTLFWRMCPPLAELHARAVVHRDLKPENVFLRPDGTPVLMDLGLVARARGGLGRERLEIGGRVVGTASYMSPEQASGQLVDARADLYALGAMLYEAVTGRKVIDGGPYQVVLARIAAELPAAPSSLVRALPPEVDALILGLLAKDPRRRVGHADDVAEQLRPFVPADLPVPPRTVESRPYLYRPGFHGREDLRAALESRVEQIERGTGGVVYLAGESGVGKTFLLAEIGRIATATGIRVVTAECLPVGAGSHSSVVDVARAPLHPFRPFFVSLADRCRLAPPDVVDQLLGARARILAPYEAALATTPAYASYPAPAPVSAELGRRRVVSAVLDTLAAVATAEQGAVLVLDDLHWADDLTLSVLHEVDAAWIGRTPLLIVGTWRAEEATADLARLAAAPHARFEAVGRLRVEDVHALVADMLAMPDPPPAFVEFVYSQTGGNPFFVAEYLRTAVDEGLLLRQHGRWTFTDQGFANFPVPGSLLDLVIRRLETISPRDRLVHDLAAVFGRTGTVRTLAKALGLSEPAVASTLRSSTERQVMELRDGETWRWAHDKVREAAYARIPPSERPTLHRRVAEAIEAENASSQNANAEFGALGRHWSSAGVLPKAVDAYEAAGEQALRNFSMPEAREFFTACVDLAETVPDVAGPVRRARWQRGLMDAALATGQTPEALAHASAALTSFGFPMPTTRLSLVLALAGQVAQRVAAAFSSGLFRATAPMRVEALTGAAYVYQRQLEPYFLAVRPIEGTLSGLRSINLGERVPESAALARGLAFMSMIVGATPLAPVGRRWADRAVQIAERLGQPDVLAYVSSRIACFDIGTARWGDAIGRADLAQQVAGRIGDLRMVEEAQTIRIQALYYAGRFEESLAEAEGMLALALGRGDRQTASWARCFCAMNLVATGSFARAEEMTRLLVPSMADFGAGERTLFWATTAAARFGAGDLAGAREAADRALGLLRESRPVAFFQGAAVVLTPEVYLAVANRTRSPELLEQARQALAILRGYAWLYPMVAAAAERLRGELALASGRPGAAISAWKDALAVAERNRQQVETAACLHLLARHGPEARRGESATRAAALFDTTKARWHQHR